jgi:hypothetical protein
MKISDLPQPYRALAELRRSQDATSNFSKKSQNERTNLHWAFDWERTQEDWPFWNQVYLVKLPPIPQSSLDELARLNLWPVDERLPYDEKPLPSGIEPPPEGFCYVGEAVKKEDKSHSFLGRSRMAWSATQCNGLEFSGGYEGNHYAAPVRLCNRLQPAKPAEPCVTIRLPDITPVFTRTEPHTVESYRLAIIEALKSADNPHGASLVEYYPVVKTINA